jgi:uncharacterized phage-associated protein
MTHVAPVNKPVRATPVWLKKQPIRWFFQLRPTISGMIRRERMWNTHNPFTYVRTAAREGAMHDSRTVANRFLRLAAQDGKTLTPMQVLKLVYIAHGWMLGLYGRPLIRDDVQAWKYGPVIPTLYNAMRDYRSAPVTQPLRAPKEALDANEENIVEQVYEIYGKKTGLALSRLTHAAGTPWDLTYEDGTFGIVIPTDIIQDHYRRLAAK